MKIIANANSLLSPWTGIGQYTAHLLSTLKEIDTINEYHYYYGFFSQSLPPIKKLDPSADRNSLEQYKILLFKNLRTILTQIPLLGPLRRNLRSWYSKMTQVGKPQEFDLYFEPNFLPVDEIKAKKIVTMMFDLSAILYPEWHPEERTRSFRKYFDQSLSKSNGILTATQFVKNQMIEHLKIPADKIYVTPICCNEIFYKPPSDQEQLDIKPLPKNYILFVGSIEPRKNVLSLLKAFQHLPSNYKKESTILFCGPKGWKNKEVFEFIAQNKMEPIVQFRHYVSNEELQILYNKALALVYPSFYEGFGLPPLEAMSSGCPVLASNIPTHKEICGDGVLYADPFSWEDIADKLKKIFDDSALRKNLIERGKKRAHDFSWEKTAKSTLDVFNCVAQQP